MSPYRVPSPPPSEPPATVTFGDHVFRLVGVLAVAVYVFASAGCKGALPIISAALTASQLACAFESTLTDAPALADACAIDKALVPELQKIIGEREAAAKAGVRWRSAAGDGGASDAAAK